MNRRNCITVAIFIPFVIAVVVACMPSIEETEPACEHIATCQGYYVYRFIDYDAQVVCWMTTSRSLSCLPLAETALDVK